MKIKCATAPEFDTSFDSQFGNKKHKQKILDFIGILEDDEYFEHSINKIRSEFKITKFLSKKEAEKSLGDLFRAFFNNDGVNKCIHRAVLQLCTEYNLHPTYWALPFFSFVKYNWMLLPFMQGRKIIPLTGIELLNSLKKSIVFDFFGQKINSNLLPGEVVIILTDSFSKTELLKSIDEIYPQIEKCFTKLDITHKGEVPKISIHDVPLYRKIYKLRGQILDPTKQKRKSFDKIAGEINTRDGKTCSSNEVRTMYIRYKRFINSLHSDKSKK